MTPLAQPPGFLVNVFTAGIVRALWVSKTNAALNHRTGFLFAWLLQSFANYGLATRLNEALRARGSQHAESPIACFLLTGFPFIGASRRLRRGVRRLNDVIAVRQHVEVPVSA